MATKAMSLGCRSFFGALRSNPSDSILPIGDRLQVGRIHAATVAAQMVQLQASGDGTNEQLVGDTMCFELLVPDGKYAVPVSITTGHPGPAFVGLPSLNFWPESSGYVSTDVLPAHTQERSI